nr:uncharacterized protein LOC129383356 [Dermacentor andersoni]
MVGMVDIMDMVVIVEMVNIAVMVGKVANSLMRVLLHMGPTVVRAAVQMRHLTVLMVSKAKGTVICEKFYCRMEYIQEFKVVFEISHIKDVLLWPCEINIYFILVPKQQSFVNFRTLRLHWIGVITCGFPEFRHVP